MGLCDNGAKKRAREWKGTRHDREVTWNDPDSAAGTPDGVVERVT